MRRCQECSEADLVCGEIAGGVVSGCEVALLGEEPAWCSSAPSAAMFEATAGLLLLVVAGESLLSCIGVAEE